MRRWLRGGLVWAAVLALLPVAASARSGRTLDTSALGAPARNTAEGKRGGARRGAHDAVVALLGPRGVSCSGALVHPQLVLTARHCLGVRKVVFGASVDKPYLVREVVGSAVPAEAGVDVALLEILRVDVAPYAFRADGVSSPSLMRVVGFGMRDFRDPTSTGRRSYFDVRAASPVCSRSQAQASGCVPGLEFSLPRSSGVDTCEGDSGGPVLQRHAGSWRVVGVTSRSVSAAVLPCGDGGIYVRVDRMARWIEARIADLENAQN